MRTYLQALAAQDGSLPVLVVEDLHWGASTAWGARMLELAQTTGNQPYVVMACWRLSNSALRKGDLAAAMQWCERMSPIARAVENRTMQSNGLRQLANLYCRQDNVAAVLPLFLQAQAGFQADVAALAAPADRDRVIQSRLAYRDIVAAWSAAAAARSA